MDEQTARLALSLVAGVGSGRLHALVEAFDGSAASAWRARDEWHRRAGMSKNIVAAAKAVTPAQIDRARRRLDDLKARILIKTDPEYPQGLTHVTGPTPVLFVRGRLPKHFRAAVAMVGTRRPSSSGRRLAHDMAAQLSAVGLTVVSGMALGIDGAAHRGALQTGGTTVAVLGSGLDVPYPRRHADLMEEIVHSGAVVTEYPLGTEPLPRHFPARNRIIAGLSAAVVLVESGRTGGAMHTVDYALAASREVMAVPGDVHRWQSEGPNELLKEGAVLVRHGADVLHALGYTSGTDAVYLQSEAAATRNGQPARPGEKASGDDAEGRIVAALTAEGAQTPDELGKSTGLTVERLAAALTWLEVSGRIVRVPGGRFDVPRGI